MRLDPATHDRHVAHCLWLHMARVSPAVSTQSCNTGSARGGHPPAVPHALRTEECSAFTGGPQCLCCVPQLFWCGQMLLILLLLILLQDANPGLQQVLVRLAAHEQRRIQEEVPADITEILEVVMEVLTVLLWQ